MAKWSKIKYFSMYVEGLHLQLAPWPIYWSWPTSWEPLLWSVSGFQYWDSEWVSWITVALVAEIFELFGFLLWHLWCFDSMWFWPIISLILFSNQARSGLKADLTSPPFILWFASNPVVTLHTTNSRWYDTLSFGPNSCEDPLFTQTCPLLGLHDLQLCETEAHLLVLMYFPTSSTFRSLSHQAFPFVMLFNSQCNPPNCPEHQATDSYQLQVAEATSCSSPLALFEAVQPPLILWGIS